MGMCFRCLAVPSRSLPFCVLLVVITPIHSDSANHTCGQFLCGFFFNPNGCLGNRSRFLTTTSIVQNSNLRPSINHFFSILLVRTVCAYLSTLEEDQAFRTRYAHVHNSHHLLLIPLGVGTTPTSCTGGPEMGCRLGGWDWGLFRRSPCKDI